MDKNRLNRVFDQVRPSPDREEAMLDRLLREEEREGANMLKHRNKLRAAVLVAAALAVILAGTALAGEIASRIEVRIYESKGGERAGYSAPTYVMPVPLESLPEEARSRVAGVAEYEKWPFASRAEAEEFFGVELAKNSVLEGMKRSTTYVEREDGSYDSAPCWAHVLPYSGETVTSMIQLESGYENRKCWIHEEVTLLIDSSGQEVKPVRSNLSVGADGRFQAEEYTTPSGLEVSIVTHRPEGGGILSYEAHFVLGGLRFSVSSDGALALTRLKEVLDGYPPDVTVESEGTSLRVRQAWADQYRLAVLWELTAPEGTVLDGDAYRLEGDHGEGWRVSDSSGARSIWSLGSSAWAGGWSLIEDGDPADNHIVLLHTLHAKGGAPELVGGQYAFQFTRLLTGNIGQGDTVLEGDWSGSIPLPERDVGKRYDAGQALTLDGQAVTLDSVYVSPITVALELGEGAMDLRRTDYRQTPTDWREHVFLVTADGERIAMDPQQGSLGPNLSAEPEKGRYVCQPERIINPAEIAAVELFGQTVALKG